ncbi:hypothetical protein LMG32289_05459 [Cupriavidus pampae]|uniref:ApeA N-terminal domain-containing protein n=2 Tax=Cupriavidus pampae TaxID=659251 RepID=A0ABN7ZI77_9BURK|nr:hypothetical protein LMG32289_05459 [Cupriavidus pampae]
MAAGPHHTDMEFLMAEHGEGTWVTVFEHIGDLRSGRQGALYCALADKDVSARAMADYGWDVQIGTDAPGFVTSYSGGEETSTYYPRSADPFQRLVYQRTFHGRKDGYIELCEEFRLLHNLYFDAKANQYITFDEAGDEVVVVKLSADRVEVRRSYLRSFMAATQRDLLLYFEFTHHFNDPVDPIESVASDTLRAEVYSGGAYVAGYKYFVRIVGKKRLLAAPLHECGIAPFEKAKRFEAFLIGGDDDAPILHTSDPATLRDYFGGNPDAPHYLTPVFFRMEVMKKYYGSSDYEIEDGRLSRKGAWSLRLDNNAPGHVSVFLGDLGRELPSKEQLYWKSFNIVPDGRTMSHANFARSFLGQFHESENPAHLFKQKFTRLNKRWAERAGWELFLPLADKDRHFFDDIRSLLTNEQAEFDALILCLAKTTIDSLNVKGIRKSVEGGETDKSIALLGQLLARLNVPDAEAYVTLLHGVQTVRSTGVAHRKGTDYEKAVARYGIDANDYAEAFNAILLQFVRLFDALLDDLGE